MTTTDQAPGLSDLQALATTDRPRLPGRLMRITTMDGSVHEVRVLNKDRVAWDKTRGKKKWEPATEAPFLAGNFLAFCAAQREGVFTGTFDAFVDWAGDVEDVTGEEEEAGADPTKKGPEPGSA